MSKTKIITMEDLTWKRSELVETIKVIPKLWNYIGNINTVAVVGFGVGVHYFWCYVIKDVRSNNVSENIKLYKYNNPLTPAIAIFGFAFFGTVTSIVALGIVKSPFTPQIFKPMVTISLIFMLPLSDLLPYWIYRRK